MISRVAQQLIKRQTSVQKYGFAVWNEIPLGPADPVLGLTEAFKKDQHPAKVNLGLGAYRDNSGKPVIMKCVNEAEKIILETKKDNEYLPTQGDSEFVKHSLILAYGKELYEEIGPRLAALQVLSGTGALRLACEFIKRYMPNATFYYPDPTWPNHLNVARDAQVPMGSYYWYDPATKLANFQRIYESIEHLPNGSAVLLHACAQNPTGCDLNTSEWQQLAELFKQKEHLAFFDMAYQGFTSGDIHKDAESVRLFAKENIPLLTCQSYAKNMGLYGQRIGCLSFLFNTEKIAQNAVSQLKIIARPMWSSPPCHGSQIAKTILGTPVLYDLWLKEVKEFADRITSMRTLLQQNLIKQGSEINWDHLVSQQGMFAYTGLNQSHCQQLIDEYHVYLMKSGRISVAGITEGNVEYLANAIHNVTKGEQI